MQHILAHSYGNPVRAVITYDDDDDHCMIVLQPVMPKSVHTKFKTFWAQTNGKIGLCQQLTIKKSRVGAAETVYL